MAQMNRIWKMYVLFSFVVVVAMTFGGFVLQRQLRQSLDSHLREDVLTLVRVLGMALPAADSPAEYETWCEDYGKATAVRVTVIAEDGTVVCDSSERHIRGSDRMERPEVSEAIRHGAATEIRYSGTYTDTMLYAALHVPQKGKIVRLSLPMKRVQGIENEIMAFLVAAVYLSPFLAVLIAFFFFKRLVASHDQERLGFKPGSSRLE